MGWTRRFFNCGPSMKSKNMQTSIQPRSSPKFLISSKANRKGMDPDRVCHARRVLKWLWSAKGILPVNIRVDDVICAKKDFINPGPSSSVVMKGLRPGPKGASQPVALKCILHHRNNRQDYESTVKFFKTEVFAWLTLDHKNVIAFHGLDYSALGIGLPCLVLEWAENGSILHCIRELESKKVDIPLNKWIGDIVEGLRYIHCEQIAHGDLRGANVLITEDLTAKLSDLRLAKFVDTSGITEHTGRSGAEKRWSSPEFVEQERRFGPGAGIPTIKGDVYSFGCLWLEIHTRREPYRDYAISEVEEKLQTPGEYPDWPTSGLRSKDVETTKEKLRMSDAWQFVRRCLSHEPEDRPSTEELVCLQEFETFWMFEAYSTPSPGRRK
ncbi:kinase-like protein [Panus rudis PR-1116 ss-1]|nr:kinase-like protein [Panus rudis PR-1116 ss-1]